MTTNFGITKKEMLAALSRSGYLLESEISATLANSGFFVECNQVIKDPFTGKSREIDLLAEYFHPRILVASATRHYYEANVMAS